MISEKDYEKATTLADYFSEKSKTVAGLSFQDVADYQGAMNTCMLYFIQNLSNRIAALEKKNARYEAE